MDEAPAAEPLFSILPQHPAKAALKPRVPQYPLHSPQAKRKYQQQRVYKLVGTADGRQLGNKGSARVATLALDLVKAVSSD